MTNCCQEAGTPLALLGFLEGRGAGGVAAPGSEGCTGLAGVAEVPALPELGWFSLLENWAGFPSVPGRTAMARPCLVGILVAPRPAEVPDL